MTTTDLPLRCQCGKLRGTARGVSPTTGKRVVCLCADCQTYARWLAQPGIMDAHGGTDIYQITPSQLAITSGIEHLRCVRLSPKGLLRWYAGCCRTPIGNSLSSARMPFVGIVHSFMEDHAADGRAKDDVLGPPLAFIHGREAIGGLPPHAHPKAPLGLMLGITRFLAGAWLSGKARPTPLFDAKTHAPVVEPHVLTHAERDEMRVARDGHDARGAGPRA
jgi:hypothetical protein